MQQRERSAKETVARNVDGRHTLDISLLSNFIGDVMAVIVWQLDLQLPMQSVLITNDVVGWTPLRTRCTTLCDKVKFVSDLRQVGGVSSTKKN